MKWTKEDERKSSELTLRNLLDHKEDFIERLGKERYERSIAELRKRLGIKSPSEDSDSSGQ